MNMRKERWLAWRRKLAWPFWVALLMGYSAMAASVVIDSLDADYAALSQVGRTTAHASEARRTLSATQLAAVYRAGSAAPFATLPPGSTLKVVWPDGSSEYVVIVDPAASVGVQAVPGTRRSAQGEAIAGDAVAPDPR